MLSIPNRISELALQATTRAQTFGWVLGERLERRLDEERGATTAEYVVLTAAVIGIMLFVGYGIYSMVTAGATTVANTFKTGMAKIAGWV